MKLVVWRKMAVPAVGALGAVLAAATFAGDLPASPDADARATAGPPASLWTNVATPLVAGIGLDGHRGAAWVDFDADGDLDLYLANWGPSVAPPDPLPGSPNQLLRNDGGTFVDATTPALAMAGGVQWGLSHHPAWGDIDNDGLPDLFVTQSSNFNQDISRLIHQTAPGVFVDATAGEPLALAGTLPRGVAWVDYDLDGLLDIFISNSGGDDQRNRLLRNLGDGTFERMEGLLEEVGRESRGAAWGDINNDGLPDLYIGNGAENSATLVNRYNALYLNVGGGNFIDIALHAGVRDDGHARGVFFGDVNNDGWLDLLVGNNNGSDVPGLNVLWVNNGDLTFTDVSLPAGIWETLRTRDVSMADFDNDGDLDLYVANFGNSNPPNRLWRNNGDTTYTNVAIGTPVEAPFTGNGGVWGDFDEDGWIDLYIVGGDTSLLCRNDNQDGSHWLEIDLQGVVSNRPAIGARVRTVADGVTRIREVQSGTGYNAQHMQRVHLGFGASTVVDVVEVRWPSGRIQRYSDVDVDQRLTIVEDVAAPFTDCNENGMADVLELAAGTSRDCDHDGIPDECDPDMCDDCNENGIRDDLELTAGLDDDCDGNGVLDSCDIAANPGLDADRDGIIDFCIGGGDANGDGSVDVDDLVIVIASWGPCPAPCPPDFNGDGVVDVNDLVITVANWSV